MVRMLVAVLVLMALVVGPVRAFAMAAAAAPTADLLICHASAADADQTPAQAPVHAHDCQLCPACHLAAQPALAAGAGVFVSAPAITMVADTTLLPPATGPPSPVDAATPSTGPPASAV